ncbi:helix-turn-helix transcriptional regulator [Lactiplantibacillus paraxiangfangensis]|uniref:helix-turn-helix domain-containing protein n=1 Tax=Lactiplantibacillus paraxiangfangensis TaxID=3076224 RepID=UPI0030C6B03A
MASINFNDYLKDVSKDSSFKQTYANDYSKLASATALMQAREAAGLTQQDLANKASVPQSTIARIENGSNTTLDTLSKIAFALGKRLTISFS